MRILITGSSGQIGTNLALRLLGDGHEVFGVDKRANTWTDRFPTLLQDLSGNFPASAIGIGDAEYPKCDVVVHLAANAKVQKLSGMRARTKKLKSPTPITISGIIRGTLKREE